MTPYLEAFGRGLAEGLGQVAAFALAILIILTVYRSFLR